MVQPDGIAVVRPAGNQLGGGKTLAIRIQIVFAAHDAHTAGQHNAGIFQQAHARFGQALLQVRTAEAWLPPMVEQVVIAQHVVFAQRRVDLAEQAAECFQFLRLGEFIKNIAGQHQQVGVAGGNFLPQFGDAGVVHGCAGAGVDIADLHDAQTAMGQSFMRS